MTGGIIDRFRTMAISRAAVLTGHVIGSLLQTLTPVLVLVLGVSLAMGFLVPCQRPCSGWPPLGMRIAAVRVRPLIWLSAALGLAAKSVETASNTPMFLTLLPFLSGAFVPTASMPKPELRRCRRSTEAPSPRSPKPSAACSPAAPSQPSAAPSPPSPGAPLSPSPAISGQFASTAAAGQPSQN